MFSIQQYFLKTIYTILSTPILVRSISTTTFATIQSKSLIIIQCQQKLK